jgi:hypothetical protein
MLHFKETRPPIGQEEAAQLLRLKTKRGGTDRLNTIQRTVKSLLGVSVDAFEPESGARRQSAEMDVDEFLVEANGAGIREALRIVLDVELKEPALALIEEPEVHLHPGLERAVHTYLSSKRGVVQMFVATHSTSFVDVSEGQSIYILSRDETGLTKVEQVTSEADRLKIPEEVGLRPSTVFMFDKLVFVEGESDERILRAFADVLDIDLSRANVAFVHMGGAANFSNFAADATLSLLSRRKIPMWFVLDRDERQESDLKKIRDKLGAQAKLVDLDRRELENYLFDEGAISRSLAGRRGLTAQPTSAEVGKLLNEGIEQHKKRTVELRSAQVLLKPVYPERGTGEIAERIDAAIKDLQGRRTTAETLQAEVAKDIDSRWVREAQKLVPGGRVLEFVFSKLKLRYSKLSDGPRIASEVHSSKVDPLVSDLLRELIASRR